MLRQRLTAQSGPGKTTCVAVVSFEGRTDINLIGPTGSTQGGIGELQPQESDAFVRLDTGHFDLEMCTGTGQGTGDSKWGLRHFRSLEEGVDLLPSGNNAIGGFYGPFFTRRTG